MFCPECGEAVDASAKFCTSCGKRLVAVNPALPVETPDVPERGAEDFPEQIRQPSTAGLDPPINGKEPYYPELGIIWSLLLTPIAGAIFYSINWRLLGARQHQWWTWASAIATVVVATWIDYLGDPIIGVLLVIAWAVGLFAVQRKMIKPAIHSAVPRIVSVILGLVLLVYAIVQMQPNTGAGSGNGASLILGTQGPRIFLPLLRPRVASRRNHGCLYPNSCLCDKFRS